MTTIAQLNTPAVSSRPDGARTKLVIRRLPPTLPEEIFWKSVTNWVSDETTSWKQYIEGRKGDEHDAHPIFSRAYILFKSPEAVLEFRTAYDGHVFRAKTGEEYQAVVEYAPIQRTPLTAKVKVDSRQGTIDDDPDYLSFLNALKMPAEKAVLEVSAPIVQPTSTPLLDHLRIHGRGGKGSKKQKTTTASSSDARGRAIASVSAAAAKRAPHADNGPILVAGKGRDVTVAESVPPPAPAPVAGKKSRNKKKDKAPSVATTDGSPGTAVQPQTPQTPAHTSLPSRPPKAPKQRQERSRVEGDSSQPGAARTSRAEGEGAGRETRQIQGRVSRRGEGGGEGGAVEGGAGGRGGRGRGGRGGRRGGGAGGERGAGGADGEDRSARGAVVSILSKNAEGNEGRGSGPGRGRGRGGGSGPAPAATMARIDD